MREIFAGTHRGSAVKTVLLNCILGCIPAVLALLFSNVTVASLAETAFDGIVYANCIGLLSWWLIPRLLQRLGCSNGLLRIVGSIAGLAICSVIGCLAANLILMSLGLVHSTDLWSVFRTTIKVCILITVSFGLLTTVIATLQEKLRSTTLALREKELAEARALKMAAEARFASLESRVHPHFLFNTLNSISALVREDPLQAERMIERLSALLRFSLDSELAGLVPLAEELQVTQQYLEIEKVRFGGRLRFSIDAGIGTESRQVPPLSVQTLVENSVKYAVGTAREGAEIVVRSWLEGGELRIEVSDDGPGFDPMASCKPGHGLDLLKRRLTEMFGDGASLRMFSAMGRMIVEITVAA